MVDVVSKYPEIVLDEFRIEMSRCTGMQNSVPNQTIDLSNVCQNGEEKYSTQYDLSY